MKLALVQLDSAWEDEAANLSRARQFADRARANNCSLICFPEMSTTGFSMNVSRLRETPPSVSGWAEIARESRINVLAGYARRTAGRRGQNLAALFDSTGSLQAEYAKMRMFPLANEGDHYIPGTSPVVFDVDGVSATVFICYDLRFPELFRAIARRVSIIFVLANWPTARKTHWDTLLKARAIENQCFVVGVNRIGNDGNGVAYHGGSLVITPSGVTMVDGLSDQEYIETVIDPSEVGFTRSRWPFLDEVKDLL